MNLNALIPGLEFIKKHNLTHREIEVLIPFLEKPYTTLELAEFFKVKKETVIWAIKRLNLKGLLIIKEIDAKGTHLYGFNQDQLED